MTNPTTTRDPLEDLWDALHGATPAPANGDEPHTRDTAEPTAADASPYQTIIDVYVVAQQPHEETEAPDEPVPVVESDLRERTTTGNEHAPQETPLAAFPSEAPSPRSSRRRRVLPILLLALVVCALIGAGLLTLLPLLTPSATVTLIPVSRQVSTSSTLSLVTDGRASLTPQQIAGRALPTLTLSQQTVVPTTGIRLQEAQAARGSILFYNAAPISQVIAAGTLLVGADGVQMVTEVEALLPAALPPTEGQASVPAHALLAGPSGNIGAGDIAGACCRENVFVRNLAFGGGQNARTLRVVSQHDLDGAVTSLKTSLQTSIQAALSAQVQPGESLLAPVACIPTTHSDVPVGAEAVRLHVTLDDTCTGQTYHPVDVQRLLLQRLGQQAASHLGTSYRFLPETVQVNVRRAASTGAGVRLDVRGSASWVYQFSQPQLLHLKTLVAGKSLAQAKALLLSLPGVESVSLSETNGSTLPTDPSHLHLVLIAPW